MIPRPDQLGIKYNLCDPNGPPTDYPDLVDKAIAYGLCDEEVVVDPTIMNRMDPADALALANAVHRQLRFTVVPDGTSDVIARIEPVVPDEDILEACDVLDERGDETAQMFCSDIRGRCNDKGECKRILYLPFFEEAEVLVPVLNMLYGTASPNDMCVQEDWGVTFGCPIAGCAEPPQGRLGDG